MTRIVANIATGPSFVKTDPMMTITTNIGPNTATLMKKFWANSGVWVLASWTANMPEDMPHLEESECGKRFTADANAGCCFYIVTCIANTTNNSIVIMAKWLQIEKYIFLFHSSKYFSSTRCFRGEMNSLHSLHIFQAQIINLCYMHIF